MRHSRSHVLVSPQDETVQPCVTSATVMQAMQASVTQTSETMSKAVYKQCEKANLIERLGSWPSDLDLWENVAIPWVRGAFAVSRHVEFGVQTPARASTMHYRCLVILAGLMNECGSEPKKNKATNEEAQACRTRQRLQPGGGGDDAL